MNQSNNRVLVIDDDQDLLDHYRSIMNNRPANVQESESKDAFDLLFPPTLDAMKDPSFWFRIVPTFASSGMEALALLQEAMSNDKPFAMAICDVKMPGWDGVKTIEELRKRDSKLRVTFVSAYADAGYFEVNRRVAGDFHFYSKPMKPEELLREVSDGVLQWNSLWSDIQFSKQLEKNGSLSAKDFQSSLIETFRCCVGAVSALCWKRFSSSWWPVVSQKSSDAQLISALGRFFSETGVQAVTNCVPLAADRVVYLYAIASDAALVLEFQEPLSQEKSYLLDVTVLGMIGAGVFEQNTVTLHSARLN